MEDIPLLVDHFLRKYAATSGSSLRRVTSRAMDALQNRPWEGNVRELENIIERLVVLTAGETIDLEDLPNPGTPVSGTGLPGSDESLTLSELQRNYVMQVLDHADGNKEKAARILGINRRTLYRMQERWSRS